MTNREKLNELRLAIKNLNEKFFKLDELITGDGFGDMNELVEYQNITTKINKAMIDYHSFIVKIVQDGLELDNEIKFF